MAETCDTKPPKRGLIGNLHTSCRENSWQYRLGHLLERPSVEAILLVLLLVDIGCVVVEGGIDLDWWCIHPREVDVPPEQIVAAAAAGDLRGPGAAAAAEEAAAHHLLRASSAVASSLVMRTRLGRPRGAVGGGLLAVLQHAAGAQATRRAAAAVTRHGPPAGALVCEGEGGETRELLEEACHSLSICILCIFLAENLLKMSVHFQEFFSRPLHVLDFAVVAVSLVCDALIAPWLASHDEKVAGAELTLFSGALIFFRIWRVIRVLHGIFEVLHAEVEGTEKLEGELKDAHERIRSLEASLATKA